MTDITNQGSQCVDSERERKREKLNSFIKIGGLLQ